jgi:hypothetical protein
MHRFLGHLKARARGASAGERRATRASDGRKRERVSGRRATSDEGERRAQARARERATSDEGEGGGGRLSPLPTH